MIVETSDKDREEEQINQKKRHDIIEVEIELEVRQGEDLEKGDDDDGRNVSVVQLFFCHFCLSLSSSTSTYRSEKNLWKKLFLFLFSNKSCEHFERERKNILFEIFQLF